MYMFTCTCNERQLSDASLALLHDQPSRPAKAASDAPAQFEEEGAPAQVEECSSLCSDSIMSTILRDDTDAYNDAHLL